MGTAYKDYVVGAASIMNTSLLTFSQLVNQNSNLRNYQWLLIHTNLLIRQVSLYRLRVNTYKNVCGYITCKQQHPKPIPVLSR